MFDCHQSEESFWRTMNPARLIQLFDARFSPGVRSGHRKGRERMEVLSPGAVRYVDLSPRDDEEDGTRLAAYFSGGAS